MKNKILKTKKAQVVSFYDISAWVILVLGLIIWVAILRFENLNQETIIEHKIKQVNNEEIFISILRSNYKDMQMSDKLLKSYKSNEVEEFKEELNDKLTFLYGAEVCWKLFINEEGFINEECKTDSKDELLNSIVYLPFKIDTTMKSNKVNLVITGYKK